MTNSNANLALLLRQSGTRTEQSSAAHPTSVPLPGMRWKSRLLAPGLLLVTVLGVFAYAARDVLTPTIDVHVVPVILKAGIGGGTPAGGAAPTANSNGAGGLVRAPGWVESDPYSIAVSALIDGVVEEVLVLEGETVTAGQVVARLVDSDARLALQRAAADVGYRRAELEHSQATLVAAEITYKNPVERLRARDAAQAKLARAEAELAQWPAELAAAQARADEMKAELDRVEYLQASANSTPIELVRARKQFEAAAASLESVRGRKPILTAEVAALQAEARAAAENLRLLTDERRVVDESRAHRDAAAAELARAEAAHAEAALRLERTQVRAPAGGVVLARLVEPGSKVMFVGDMPRSAQIVRLYDPQKLQVRVDIPLVDAARVGVGQPAEVIVQVLPDRVFRGVVTRVVHEADVQRNTLQVKVRIEDPAPQLKPEMLAQARFLPSVAAASSPTDAGNVSGTAGGVFAPAALVHDDSAGGAVVWLVDQRRSVAVRRSVQRGGVKLGDWIEVIGLQPGDRLITGDPARLRQDARVHVLGEDAAIASAHGGH